MQASVNQHSQLEIDEFRRQQPVKVLQDRCDVLIPRRSIYQSGGGVEHRLKATELGRRKPCECCVAVIETCQRCHNIMFMCIHMHINIDTLILNNFDLRKQSPKVRPGCMNFTQTNSRSNSYYISKQAARGGFDNQLTQIGSREVRRKIIRGEG